MPAEFVGSAVELFDSDVFLSSCRANKSGGSISIQVISNLILTRKSIACTCAIHWPLIIFLHRSQTGKEFGRNIKLTLYVLGTTVL